MKTWIETKQKDLETQFKQANSDLLELQHRQRETAKQEQVIRQAMVEIRAAHTALSETLAEVLKKAEATVGAIHV